MSKSKRGAATAAQKPNVLASLKATEIIISKPVLPAELFAQVLDYLPIPDLLRFAQVSKRYQEMVYDDARWIKRLINMGCWDEAEARRHSEGSLRGSVGSKSQWNRGPGSHLHSKETTKSGTHIGAQMAVMHGSMMDGPGLQGSPGLEKLGLLSTKIQAEPLLIRVVLSQVNSIRGLARQEYGKVYGALAPFYLDIIRASNHTEPILFRHFQAPTEQARMLAQLRAFAKSDITPGGQQREDSLVRMIDVFEEAALREFELGLQTDDIDGKARNYAQVLVALNGGQRAIDLFVRKNSVLESKADFGDPRACLPESPSGKLSLKPSHAFFQTLSAALNEQSTIIDRVFPSSLNVFSPLFDCIGREVISEYVATLLNEAHKRNMEFYIEAVPGLYQQARAFTQTLRPPHSSAARFPEEAPVMLARIFEPHVELYLKEEQTFFQQKSDAEVNDWEQKLSEEAASTESFFMSNVNRQVAKKDFLSSFKKVVMMPVNILPAFPLSSSQITSSGKSANDATGNLTLRPTLATTRLRSGSNPSSSAGTSRAGSPGPGYTGEQAPTTELAAKAAIMNSRLEGIRSLFSIEVALNLVHLAKASLERVAVFVNLGGNYGEESKSTCRAIFVALLSVLGSKHVRPGFDKAVEHLSKYNPREATTSHDQKQQQQSGVVPLATFLELVNVGDLIQQMVDVFYEQELVAANLVDRSDFLDIAAKEKKRFEQMLDERVAAGLNKGIDVLIDEVEYLFATLQLPSDYNPAITAESGQTQGQGQGSSTTTMEIGPTPAALQIVEIVSSHTKMLVGSTDKNLLDVFNQEVGLRLFGAICKHLKRQRISIDGSMRLISDMTLYASYITTLRNPELLQYFQALRELSQIYLVDTVHAKKDLASVIAHTERFYGVWRPEEVYEFAARRADWLLVKKAVERGLFGVGCGVM
ncbi:MAG: peroxisome biogenesis factor 10 [Watsoniomyces obsoletus]|nr:MAG: peroxisome biogenesis factor 10 [Watsoniomyces obsoletus]